MTRLDAPDPDQLSEAQQRIYDDIVSGPRGAVVGPLALWLHRPGLANSAQKLGQYCRYDSSLPPRLSELAILTMARLWDAPFEWDSHIGPAREAGLDETVIAALAADRTPDFADAESAVVHEVARSLVLERTLPQPLYERAYEVLGKERLVDLVGVLGYYSLISMTLTAFEVPGIE